MPRKYAPADEQIVLDRISEGTLRIDTVCGRAYVLYRGRWREATYYPDRGNYQYLRLHHRGRRRAVALHRAVWIAHNQQLLPDGAEVHHVRGKWAGNGIGNVKPLGHVEHMAEHYDRDEFEEFWNS